MMNNEDLFTQLILKPLQHLTLRTDFHVLRLHESKDRWYMGVGASKKDGNIFGYIGRPSSGKEQLATALDLTIIYTFTNNLSGVFYFSHVYGGDVIKKIYSSDEDANLFFFELQVKF